MRRRLLAVVALLALCLGGVWLWRGGRGGGAGAGGAGAAAAGKAVEGGGKGGRGGGAGIELPEDPRKAKRGAIAGHVRDELGAALAGASVCAFARSSELVSEDTRVPRCAQSGADGAYLIDELMPAEYGVSASAAGRKPAAWRGPGREHDFRLRAGETRRGVDLVLEGGGVELRGRVSDISGGVIGGAWVAVSSGGNWGDQATTVVRSGDDGEFSAWVSPGDVWAEAEAEGYAPGSKQGVAPGLFLEILLTPETVLVGRVVEAGSGAPVAGARVTANAERGGFMWDGDSGGSAMTDAEGRFRIERLQPGRYKPVAEAPSAWGESRESVMLGLGETSAEVLIEVHAARMVEGTVIAGGAGCARGWVQLSDPPQSRWLGVQTDDKGRAVFRAVRPGTYTVSAWCEKFPHGADYPKVVVVDKDVTGLEWALAGGFTVRGQVVDSAGGGVAGANLSGQVTGGDPRATQRWIWTETEKDGSFVIEGVAAGEYALEVNARGYPAPKEPVKVKVAADVGDLRVVLDAAGVVEGKVIDETGAPVAGVQVRAVGERADWSNDGTTTRDDGSFRLEGLRAGDYRVSAMKSWEPLRAPGTGDDDVQGVRVQVQPGKSARVTLRVESVRGSISGRVVDAQGQPVTDAFIDAQRESESASAEAGSAKRSTRWGAWGRKPTLTDTDGRFVARELAPGKYTLRAYRKGGGEAFAEHVAVGATVTLTIDTPGSLSGTATLQGGKPLEEFRITVQDKKAGFRRSERFYKTGGEWAMRDLPEGHYELSVSALEGTAGMELDLAKSEQKQGLELELQARSTVRGQVLALEDGKPVPGMMVMVRQVKGSGSSSVNWAEGGDRKYVSDADGRYEIADAPPGRVYVQAWPQNWEQAEYGFGRVVTEVEPGATSDAPPIRVPRRQLKPMQHGGDLGFELKQLPPDIDPKDVRLEVAVVRPDGPAAPAGLKVGDELVAIDGHDVRGEKSYLYWSLLEVPEGATVTLTVKRADATATVKITAGKPL